LQKDGRVFFSFFSSTALEERHAVSFFSFLVRMKSPRWRSRPRRGLPLFFPFFGFRQIVECPFPSFSLEMPSKPPFFPPSLQSSSFLIYAQELSRSKSRLKELLPPLDESPRRRKAEGSSPSSPSCTPERSLHFFPFFFQVSCFYGRDGDPGLPGDSPRGSDREFIVSLLLCRNERETSQSSLLFSPSRRRRPRD